MMQLPRASSLAFPGGKTLAGWSRSLAPFQPRRLWVGHLFLHRLEALALVRKPIALEPLARLVLEALAFDNAGPGWLVRLDERLHLGQSTLLPIARSLQALNLVSEQGLVGERGKQALREGHAIGAEEERRCFTFLEQTDSQGVRTAPPHFAAIAGRHGSPWQIRDPEPFPIECLAACVNADSEWKERMHFPLDVEQVRMPMPQETIPAWRQVIVDRTERLLVSQIECANGEWLTFEAKQDGWLLDAQSPVLKLPASNDAIAGITAEPTPAELQAAWKSWCQGRNLRLDEPDTVAIAMDGILARIQATPFFLKRLQQAKSEALKGEGWLLLGDGYLRRALKIDVTAPAS